MAAATYEIVLQMAASLPPEEQSRLVASLAQQSTLPASPAESKKHSIMEFEGLGEQIWHGIDAKEYVRKLRDEWDG